MSCASDASVDDGVSYRMAHCHTSHVIADVIQTNSMAHVDIAIVMIRNNAADDDDCVLDAYDVCVFNAMQRKATQRSVM